MPVAVPSTPNIIPITVAQIYAMPNASSGFTAVSPAPTNGATISVNVTASTNTIPAGVTWTTYVCTNNTFPAASKIAGTISYVGNNSANAPSTLTFTGLTGNTGYYIQLIATGFSTAAYTQATYSVITNSTYTSTANATITSVTITTISTTSVTVTWSTSGFPDNISGSFYISTSNSSYSGTPTAISNLNSGSITTTVTASLSTTYYAWIVYLTSTYSSSDIKSVSTGANVINLYNFTSFTFRCGTPTNPTVLPTLSIYSSVYPGYNTSYALTITNGIQYWTVPCSGNYTLIAAGACGGNVNFNGTYNGGLGCLISTTINLVIGQILIILIGQKGATSGTSGSGGGGTFIALGTTLSSAVPILIAGGGGGASYSTQGASGGNGLLTMNNNSIITGNAACFLGTSTGAPGMAGGGNNGGNFNGNGGAGFYGNYDSIDYLYNQTISYSFVNGGSSYQTGNTIGSGNLIAGFGGGGICDPYGNGGGGGGGFSGGSSGYLRDGTAVGGGSYDYNNPTGLFRATAYGSGTNNDNGYVTIALNSQSSVTSYVPSLLYSFSSFTFTNLDGSYSTRPTSLSSYGTSYPGYNTSYALTINNGIQKWVVPITGTYQITAAGAGYFLDFGVLGSIVRNGIVVSAKYTLIAGSIISIVVGQPSGSYVGGCGGTFVIDDSDTPIIIAGGAGGAGTNGILSSALLGTNTFYTKNSDGTIIYIGGNVSKDTAGGGGGAGFSGNGNSDYSNTSYGGTAYVPEIYAPGGLAGGGNSTNNTIYSGGFGGGGSGSVSTSGGGGGGGYVGGNAGYYNGGIYSSGGGGSSFGTTRYNGTVLKGMGPSTTNGYVTITYNPSITLGINDGSTSALAADSARDIMNVYLQTGRVATDGVYWINLPNVGPRQIYCLMNPNAAGGGWMMAMKATRGTTFNYSSSYWTGNNILNPTDNTRNDGDAKFETMNNYVGSQLLALFPDLPNGGSLGGNPYGCWSWIQDYSIVLNGYSQTMTYLFNNANNSTCFYGYSNFSGWGSYWSTEGGNNFYGFNFTAYSANVRWGFAFNNEYDWNSNDVSGGIGMNWQSYSAGDYISYDCCTVQRGLNRSMRVEIYVR